MKYICVQPAIDYYTWQVEVMINNFIKNGINPNHIEIVCAYYNAIPANWRKLADTYNTVRFFFYKDERPGKNYISSVRPYILHQHWLHYPELETETIFYHDCDIILSKKAQFDKLEKDDVCYVSDTVSYIGANYVLSKGERYLNIMTNIVGIDKDLVIENELDSGGAQYILKNISAEFWKKVYEDAETLFTRVSALIHLEKPDHALQIWCADMWAVLWNLWLFGKQVKVTDKMSFSWATSGIYDWDKHPIYHNAGVVGDTKDMFFKGKFQKKLPFDYINIDDLNKQMCNYKYAEEILKTKEVSCLIK
jgi:hypothetical protein